MDISKFINRLVFITLQQDGSLMLIKDNLLAKSVYPESSSGSSIYKSTIYILTNPKILRGYATFPLGVVVFP